MLPSTYLNYHFLVLNGFNIACDGLRARPDIEDTCLAMVLISNFTLSSARVFVFVASTSSTTFLERPCGLRLFRELGVSGDFWELGVSVFLQSIVPIIYWTSSSKSIGCDATWAS